jgi:HAE1 family hydrophobic/amphiphilic exporter-1
VEVAGGRDREIQVILNPVALREYKISYQDVCAWIAGNSATTPSGYITQRDDRVSLRMIGAFEDINDLAETPIPTGDGQAAALSLIGEVADGFSDPESVARADGKEVIQLSVSGRANADIVKAGAEIKRTIDRLTSETPELSVAYTSDDTGFVQSAVKNVIWGTCIGIALTVLVIYLFLGQLSSTFIIAAAMPVAFVSTFFPIWLHGFSLNLMTPLGLGLSMGVLVDNAILVLENIYRFRDMGHDPYEAAELGTAEISTSVLAGVLTNLGVFLPVAMISGTPGQFLKPFAITILYAAVFSLWVTMSVIPSMAARLISKSRDIPRVGRILTGWWIWLYDGFHDIFLWTLRKTLRHPVITLIFFGALAAGAFKLGSGLSMDSMPFSDNGSIAISISLSNNVSLEATTARTIDVENFIASLPEAAFIEHVVSTIGATEIDQSFYKSTISVYMKDLPDRPGTNEVADVIRDYLATQSGVEYAVVVSPSMFNDDPIEIQIKGEEFPVLMEIAEVIRASAAVIPGVTSLSFSTELDKPELRILPVRWRLAQLEMDIETLARVTRGYLNGLVAGKFRSGGGEYDIKVRLDARMAGDIYSIGQLPITTKFGVVPLDELANVKWGDAPTEVRRIERERALVIVGNIQDVPMGDVLTRIQGILNDMELPPGYSVHLGGEAEDIDDSSDVMGTAIILAIIITFLVIASILESPALALIILFSVPMSAIGVVPLMMATGANVSIFVMIGMVMLVGLVVNNAIIVVDYAEMIRREGARPDEAILRACEIRFKSIVMGVCTSIVSFMPLAMATGQGSEFRWPIAVVAIGGLIAGGLLALLAIPAAYNIYWSIRRRIMMKRLIPLAIILMMFAGRAEAEAPVSLDEFLNMVRAGNDMLSGEAKLVESALYSALATSARHKASLGASATAGYLSGQEGSPGRESDISEASVSVGLTQAIDISGKFSREDRRAVLNYGARREELAQMKNELLADAEERYWSAVIAAENVALQRDVLRQRTENRRITEEKYRHKLVPRLDVLRADSLVADAESSVAEAKAERLNILASMAQMTGGAAVEPRAISLSPPELETEIGDAVDPERRPDVRAARFAIEIADVEKQLAARGMSPTMDASVNCVVFSDPSASSSPQMGEFMISIRIDARMSDNGTKYETMSAEMARQAAESSMKHILDTANMELVTAKNNWNRASAMERSGKNEVSTSNEELRITELMYREGMGAQIDLINAQTENQKVRTNYLRAVKEMYDAMIRIRRATGGYAVY